MRGSARPSRAARLLPRFVRKLRDKVEKGRKKKWKTSGPPSAGSGDPGRARGFLGSMAMKRRNALNRITNWFLTTNITVAIAAPLLVALTLLAFLLFVGVDVFHGKIPETYGFLSIALCSFVASLTGLIQIIRRETYGLVGGTVRGVWPIVT
jgi:hypothetical protein